MSGSSMARNGLVRTSLIESLLRRTCSISSQRHLNLVELLRNDFVQTSGLDLDTTVPP
jgi:hypothetical protein